MSEGLDIGTLTGRIELIDSFTHVLDSIGGAIGKFEHGWKEAAEHILEGAASFLTAEAAIHAVEGAIHLAVETLQELTVEGARVNDVETNFDHLTEAAGRLGSTLIKELRQGTHNTISDFELMKVANADLAAGLNLSDAQFRTMANGAFALAQAKAISVSEALETMNTALLSGQKKGIQRLTGVLDLDGAETKYADSLHTTTERLTEQEKLHSKQQAMIEGVGRAVDRLGEQQDGLDEKIDQSKTSWANFSEELGKTIATSPVILTGFDAIRDALVDAFGGRQEDLIERIAHAVDEAAIRVLDFAKVVVEAVADAGIGWNAFKVVTETAAQGLRAMVYVVDELYVGFLKVGNLASGGLLFGDEIAATEKDLESLYNTMAKGEASIAGNKEAEEEWANASDKAKAAIEAIQTRMEEARDKQLALKGATEEGADANERARHAADDLGQAEGALGNQMRMTKDEIKKYNEAWEAIHAVGKDLKETIRQVSTEVVDAVKHYLDAGVSIDKLKAAYKLTDEQAHAINKTWEEHNKVLKENKKATDDAAESWDHLNAMGDNQEKMIRGISFKIVDGVIHYKELGASVKDLAQAYKITEAQVEAIINVHKKETDAVKAEHAVTQQLTTAQMDQAQVIRTLSGEYITLAEAKKRQSDGGSINVNAANFAAQFQQHGAGYGIDLSMATALAKKGYSFQGLLEMLRPGTLTMQQITTLPAGQGPRIPGFREGGIGDFGDGTLAMLHGKEAIVPMGSGGLGGVTLVFNVNGTGAQVSQQIKDTIMRELKSVRQFGAA